ncbi:MAG: hypothetical protein FWF92_09625 [Oscillospiraceae bacterium]|nr:hypothetical protein [Oscillospiraceae bacterium]
MDTEQGERIKNFEERQKRIEKRGKFKKIVIGNDDGFWDVMGVFALPLAVIRLAGGLIALLVIMFFSALIKKAFKRTKRTK